MLGRRTHRPADAHTTARFPRPGRLLVCRVLDSARSFGRCGACALTVEGVGLNPTRTGLLTILRRMGARIDVSRRPGAVPDSARDGAAGVSEPTGDVTVGAVDLVGIDVGAEEVLSAIDEIPALVCAAVRARGTTRVTGARELRVKESDRVRALVDGLRAPGRRSRGIGRRARPGGHGTSTSGDMSRREWIIGSRWPSVSSEHYRVTESRFWERASSTSLFRGSGIC